MLAAIASTRRRGQTPHLGTGQFGRQSIVVSRQCSGFRVVLYLSKLSRWQAFRRVSRSSSQIWKGTVIAPRPENASQADWEDKLPFDAMAAHTLHASGVSALHSGNARHAATPVTQRTSPPKRVQHFASPPQRPVQSHNVQLHAVMAPEVSGNGQHPPAHSIKMPALRWAMTSYLRILTKEPVLQAETATSAVPELDYDALASELDMKSPLEIMDHVSL